MKSPGLAGVLAVALLIAGSPHVSYAAEGDFEIVLGIYAVGLVLYLIPTWIAFARQHPNRWLIAVINIVLGGTGLGWLGSFIWALSAVHRSPTGNNGGESGLNLFVNDAKLITPTVAPLPIQQQPVHSTFDTLSDQLTKLKRLRDDGVVTEDEYNSLRKPLVDALKV